MDSARDGTGIGGVCAACPAARGKIARRGARTEDLPTAHRGRLSFASRGRSRWTPRPRRLRRKRGRARRANARGRILDDARASAESVPTRKMVLGGMLRSVAGWKADKYQVRFSGPRSRRVREARGEARVASAPRDDDADHPRSAPSLPPSRTSPVRRASAQLVQPPPRHEGAPGRVEARKQDRRHQGARGRDTIPPPDAHRSRARSAPPRLPKPPRPSLRRGNRPETISRRASRVARRTPPVLRSPSTHGTPLPTFTPFARYDQAVKAQRGEALWDEELSLVCTMFVIPRRARTRPKPAVFVLKEILDAPLKERAYAEATVDLLDFVMQPNQTIKRTVPLVQGRRRSRATSRSASRRPPSARASR